MNGIRHSKQRQRLAVLLYIFMITGEGFGDEQLHVF
jgi:steroid 5-alpha reductase family enzyme